MLLESKNFRVNSLVVHIMSFLTNMYILFINITNSIVIMTFRITFNSNSDLST